MLKTRFFVTCAAVLAVAVCDPVAGPALAAARAIAAAEHQGYTGEGEEKPLATLRSPDAPPASKALACKQLAICGTKAAVPALAALLGDEQLASWARIALEAIPDPAADDALRQAMGKLHGKLLVGVINSIGVRRDAKAADALAQKLKDADAEVAAAAAAALGRIGGAQVVKVLQPLLAGSPPLVRTTAAESLVLCAERFLAEGNPDEAVRLYDAIRKADVPKQRILEATRGAVLARGSAGITLLVEQLRATDPAFFAIGLRTARELPGPEATAAIAAEMAQAASDRKALMLLALADRSDPKALPAVLAEAKSGPTHVRIAAMNALERFGNASCVPVLLDAATESDAELAQAARNTLARLPGQDVDGDLAARLAQASGKARQVVVELVGQRRITAALPQVVRCAEDPDAGVRAAAVAALGAVGGARQAADLVRIIQKADAAEHAGLESALVALCGREGTACAQHLMPLARSADAPLRVIALHALAAAGGPDALAALKSALGDKDQAVQDEAVRTLSTWPNRWPDDAAAAEPLLALAKSSTKPSHRVLALRGYLQFLQGTKKMSDERRLAAVKDALPLLTRTEEKRLAVSVLGTIGAAGALDALTTFAADADTAEEACSAIVNLAARDDLKGVSAQERRKALQVAAEKTKTAATRRKANDALKALK